MNNISGRLEKEMSFYTKMDDKLKGLPHIFQEYYTSLRANDLLSEGISTFYAEILRMKTINNAIKENKCLILIDEIFKGTNAYERINASFKVIDKLNSYNAYFIVICYWILNVAKRSLGNVYLRIRKVIYKN